MGQKEAGKFLSRILAGSLLAVIVGNYLDDLLGIQPVMMLLLLGYVIFGSIYLLLRDVGFKK